MNPALEHIAQRVAAQVCLDMQQSLKNRIFTALQVELCKPENRAIRDSLSVERTEKPFGIRIADMPVSKVRKERKSPLARSLTAKPGKHLSQRQLDKALKILGWAPFGKFQSLYTTQTENYVRVKFYNVDQNVSTHTNICMGRDICAKLRLLGFDGSRFLPTVNSSPFKARSMTIYIAKKGK